MSSDQFDKLINLITSRFDKVDKALDSMIKLKELLNGDDYLDNQDLCLLLGVTKRTLARYRQKKLIRSYKISGKTYYKASEMEGFLKERGKK